MKQFPENAQRFPFRNCGKAKECRFSMIRRIAEML